MAVERLEGMSDAGWLSVDQLLVHYQTHSEHPLLDLIQDIQTQIAVYQNVFEALKKPNAGQNVVTDLRQRSMELGLIPATNQWPNPDGRGLMNRALDKLSKYQKALLDILRERERQLRQELHFTGAFAVGFQLSLGTNTSFAITLQPEIQFGQRPQP
jgi:hypothetical protein